ncbi:MAG: LPXTG cell wall anchor domain-containing protein [Ruminococcaceae bacterium]|nr:LPXTG cell wall anchor domain-containing protein [Oscillospiraceae bacterium]
MKKVISFILAFALIISSIASTLLISASAEANLWASISESDYVEPPSNKWAEFGGYADGVVTIKGTISYQPFGFKMPKLEKNSDYQLSFGYNMGTAGDSIMLIRILTAAEFDAFSNSGTGYLNVTNYGKTRQILDKTKASDSTAGSYVNTGAYSFNTGDATDFILFVQIDNYNNNKRFYLNDFNLIQSASYNVSVDGGEATINGNTISKASAGATVTISATPEPDEAFEKWEVLSGDITLTDKNAFTTSFTMPENDVSIKAVYKENLWTSLVKADVVNCTSTNNFPNIYSAFTHGTVVINGINYQSFYIKMPALEANTTYKLSMSYSLTNDMSQGGMRILNKAQLDTMLASKNQYGDYTLPTAANSTANLFNAGNSGSNDACYFTTDSTTEYFVAIRCGNVTAGDTRITLSNIALTKVETHSIAVGGGSANIPRAQEGETVTITAEPPLGKQFKSWEVVSGGVTLENPDAISTTFVMPKADVSVKAVFENCANLWDGLSASNFTKLEGGCTFETSEGVTTVGNPWYTKFAIEMPELEQNTIYRLSFDYKIKLNPSMVGQQKSIAVIQLVNNDDFAIMRDDQANINNGIIDLNSKGTTVAKNVETTGEWESVISYEFDSSNQTNYTLLFALNYVLEAEFRNFKLEKIATKIAPQFDANLGSVTPATELGQVGSSITFTATPFKGNTFEGWYAADGTTLLSADMSFDYLVDDTFASPIAKFVSGTPAVENAGMENSSGKLVYFNDGAEVINDPLYKIQSSSTLDWQNLAVAENISRTGKKSLHVYAMYSFSGRTFDGLEKNTDYAISFWAYVDPTSDLSVASYVLPAGEDAVEGKSEVAGSKALGKGNIITPSDEWQEVVIKFNSGENTAVTLWINPLGQSNKLWVDDFALFRPADLEVSADLGGTAFASDSGTLAKGTAVTVTATPNDGNTFRNWVDDKNNILSTESEYKFTVDSDMKIKANFDGYNKPGYEVFAAKGQDGTFEQGSIKGWYATSEDTGSVQTWCSYQRSDAIAYEGDYSLKVYAMYQNSILPLTGLNSNTNYKLSFYVNYPEYVGMEDENHKDENGNYVDSRICPFGIVSASETNYSAKANIYADYPYSIPCGGGWYKIELYFSTGDATAVNLALSYYGYTKVGPVIYLDNISLFEYITVPEVGNADFEDGTTYWLGNGTASEGALQLNEAGATAYQSINFGIQKKYNISFRAKGKVFAGVTDVSAKAPSVMNTLSSKSYVITNSSDWENYSFDFYMGAHPDANLMFASMEPMGLVDDVVITEYPSPVDAVIETVDFETERFALRDENKTAYEIYTANGVTDKNVHSGNKSLHFKANSVNDAVTFLDEAYLGYGVIANSNYRLTLYVKTNDTVYVAPNRPAYFSTIYEITKYGAYCEKQGYEHSGSGWQKLQFTFTAEQTHVVKTVIANILGKTNGDFYIDDITVTVAPDPVIEADTEYLFCEEFFNIIPNAGFEKQVGTDNWVGLLENMQVKNNKSEADTGKYYLSLSKGEKYVMPISLEAGQVYYFAASVRGNGRVSLATMVEPTEVYFLDDNDNPASSVTSNSNKWSRSGFSFRANASGITYLVIEATNGNLDVDTLSLCHEDFKYENDPNRYEAPVKFDYDNIDPALLVYNGGFDENGNIIDTDSPATGDSATTAVLAIVITLLASATLVLFRKKEVEAND